MLAIFAASCRSVPKEIYREKWEESVAGYSSASSQEEEKQRRDSTVLHWILDTGEDWFSGTYSVRYDTSSPLDSGRSQHPVLEENYTWVVRQKKSRAEEGAEHYSTETTQTTTVRLEEAAQRQVARKAEEQNRGKILIGGGIYWQGSRCLRF